MLCFSLFLALLLQICFTYPKDDSSRSLILLLESKYVHLCFTNILDSTSFASSAASFTEQCSRKLYHKGKDLYQNNDIDGALEILTLSTFMGCFDAAADLSVLQLKYKCILRRESANEGRVIVELDISKANVMARERLQDLIYNRGFESDVVLQAFAYCLEHEIGAARRIGDEELSLRLHKRVADRSNLESVGQYCEYYFGRCMQKEDRPDIAVLYCLKAAAKGSPIGQFRVYQILYHGLFGIEKDAPKAVKNLCLAAENGHEDASRIMSLIQAVKRKLAKVKGKIDSSAGKEVDNVKRRTGEGEKDKRVKVVDSPFFQNMISLTEYYRRPVTKPLSRQEEALFNQFIHYPPL